MGLMGIYGSVGSGKTVLSVKFLCDFPELAKYGNFSLDLPNYSVLDSTKLFELEQTNKDVIVVWDEAYTEMDNRDSMSLQNRINSYILFQQRKRNLSFIGISQLNILDVRWKGLERWAIIAHDRPIKDKNGKDSTADFHYTITDGVKRRNFTFPYKKAKEYFKYFKTKEMVQPKGLDRLKEEIEIMNNPKALNKIIDNYVEKIMKIPDVPEKPTKDYVKDVMLRLGLNLRYDDFVYIRLRNRMQQKLS